MKPQIGIVTFTLDLHGWAVKKWIEDRGGASAHLIATDRTATSGRLHWVNAGLGSAALPTMPAGRVVVEELAALWYRRISVAPQAVPVELDDEDFIELVNKDCDAALHGILVSEFRGQWVSRPAATHAASDKLLQLRVAAGAGLRVPRTIASQDPEQVREFCRQLDNRVVVKVLRGSVRLGSPTSILNPELLAH